MSAALHQWPASTPAQEEWLTAERVTELTGWSDRWVRVKAQAGAIVSRAAAQNSANGKPQREYLASSLPSDAQSRLPKPALALVPPSPLEIGPLFGSAKLTQCDPVMLPDAETDEEARRRYKVLQPILDFARDPKTFAHLRLADGKPINSEARLLLWLEAQHGVNVRTLKRWKQRFRSGGYGSLADRIRSDKGESRWFNEHRRAAMLAAYLYLDQRQSVSFVHEQIARDSDLLGIAPDDLPAYQTVRIFLQQQISPAMTTLAREGRKAYRDRMAPYLRRGYTEYANQIWVADHMIHDVEVQNDLFDEAPIGTPVRLRLSAMIDYRSRMVVGYSWAWEGSSRAIAATMRGAILRYGPPEMIYCDNGKDYLKVARGAKPGYLLESKLVDADWHGQEYEQIERSGFLARLGIAVTHCIPHHPQSKHVERFFRTLHMRFDARWSTYTSGTPSTRPDATSVAMMQHRRLARAGRAHESSHPLASEFIAAAIGWIEEYNHTIPPNGGEGMDGRCPVDVFQVEANPNQRPAPDPATLALLMSEQETRRVRECAITLNKRRYMPADEMSWMRMHEANERDIRVAYDPADIEYCAALDMDGRFMAWLKLEDLVRFAPGDKKTQEQIADSMAIRRRLERATRDSIAAISQEAIQGGARPAQELLKESLCLPEIASTVITQRKARLRQDEPAATTQKMHSGDIAEMLLDQLRGNDAT